MSHDRVCDRRISGVTPLSSQLSGPPRSVADMADILERHIGDGTDPDRCREAIDALRRAGSNNPSYSVRVTLRVLDEATPPCRLVRKVIDTLRKWRYFSGA